MQMRNKKKRDEEMKKILNETEGLLQPKSKQQELEGILSGTEALTPEERKAKDEAREKELNELLGGMASITERKDFAAPHRQPYRSHYGKDTGFFTGVYRLKGWPADEVKKFRKRREVALIINRLIYNRYHPEVVEHVKRENPFISYSIRKYKHSQYITKEGQIILDKIIKDFTLMMIGYNNWDQFEFDYCSKYNLPYQLKLHL